MYRIYLSIFPSYSDIRTRLDQPQNELRFIQIQTLSSVQKHITRSTIQIGSWNGNIFFNIHKISLIAR